MCSLSCCDIATVHHKDLFFSVLDDRAELDCKLYTPDLDYRLRRPRRKVCSQHDCLESSEQPASGNLMLVVKTADKSLTI
jgi:hypothetical protein